MLAELLLSLSPSQTIRLVAVLIEHAAGSTNPAVTGSPPAGSLGRCCRYRWHAGPPIKVAWRPLWLNLLLQRPATGPSTFGRTGYLLAPDLVQGPLNQIESPVEMLTSNDQLTESWFGRQYHGPFHRA